LQGLLANTGRTSVDRRHPRLPESSTTPFTAQTPHHLARCCARNRGVEPARANASADLSALCCFVGAGVLGSAGSYYAAANVPRRARTASRQQGLPGVSMAWGWWAQATGMTGHLDERDRARAWRLIPMSSADGLAHSMRLSGKGARSSCRTIRSRGHPVGRAGGPPIFRG
jgi:polyketide synthase 12